MDRAVLRLAGRAFPVTLELHGVVYRGEVRFAGTALSGRLRHEAAPQPFEVHGDPAAWRVAAKKGQWGGLEQLPGINVIHSFAQDPDSIVLLLPDGVQLVCEFIDGRKLTAYLRSPGKDNLTVPFEAPGLLHELTEAVRASGQTPN